MWVNITLYAALIILESLQIWPLFWDRWIFAACVFVLIVQNEFRKNFIDDYVEVLRNLLLTFVLICVPLTVTCASYDDLCVASRFGVVFFAFEGLFRTLTDV